MEGRLIMDGSFLADKIAHLGRSLNRDGLRVRYVLRLWIVPDRQIDLHHLGGVVVHRHDIVRLSKLESVIDEYVPGRSESARVGVTARDRFSEPRVEFDVAR